MAGVKVRLGSDLWRVWMLLFLADRRAGKNRF